MLQAAERPYPKLTPEQKARVLAELLQEAQWTTFGQTEVIRRRDRHIADKCDHER
jgi:hypothetical protein